MRDQLNKLRQWDEQQPFTHWGAEHPWRYAALLGISVGILGVAVNWFLGAYGRSVLLILGIGFGTGILTFLLWGATGWHRKRRQDQRARGQAHRR